MVVLLATLGFTASLALAPLRNRPDIHTVHLYYGAPVPQEGKAAVAEARATCKTLDIELVEHRVKDAFDYRAVLEAMASTYSELDAAEVLVNGSGGTRPMVMATTIFAFTNDIPLLYYDEYHSQDGREIPLRAFRNLRHLGDSQANILRRLQTGPADMGTLATDVGLAPSTLSVHVQHMVESGMLGVERQGKRRIVSASPEILAMGLEDAK